VEHLARIQTPDEAVEVESVATARDRHNERRLTAGLKVVVILGPTATGKSGLALKVAERFDSEVVSADSRYLYRGMDIGTAKPSLAELASVPHHLVNVVEPQDDFSLATFLDNAFAAVEDVGARGLLPIVAGGTPLYLRAFLQGWSVPRIAPDEKLRADLELRETSELFKAVQDVDPSSAGRIGPTNKRRLIRALEVFKASGQPMSDLEGKQPPPYRILVLGLRQAREALYQRIDERVRWMFANGLLEEAHELLARGVTPDASAMSAIGYPEARAVVRGELDLEEAIQRASFKTHRYVRHQETWFRRFENVHWLDSASSDYVDEALLLVGRFIADQAGVIVEPDPADF
jgi:tRNA dimethylallyltransferase